MNNNGSPNRPPEENYGEPFGQPIPLPGRVAPQIVDPLLMDEPGPSQPSRSLPQETPRHEAQPSRQLPRGNPRHRAIPVQGGSYYATQFDFRGARALAESNPQNPCGSRAPRTHGIHDNLPRSDPGENGINNHANDPPQNSLRENRGIQGNFGCRQNEQEQPQEIPRDNGQVPRPRQAAPPADFRLPGDDVAPGDSNRPLALLNIIRRWNINFSGRPREDVESFITRVDEVRAFLNVQERDLVRVFPFLFEGSALNWYRGHADHFRTWDSMKDALRRYFADPDYQLALQEEISRRTQGDHESVRDYFSSMRGYFSRLRPPWPDSEQVRQVHRRMLPAYQLCIPLQSGLTMDELEMSAIRRERIYDRSTERRPPPRPEDSLCPSLAFRPPRARARQSVRVTASPPLAARVSQSEETEERDNTPRSER